MGSLSVLLYSMQSVETGKFDRDALNWCILNAVNAKTPITR